MRQPSNEDVGTIMNQGGFLKPTFLPVPSRYTVARQINDTTFWTSGCAVRDPQLGPRASNSRQEVGHSFASDPEGTPRGMPLSNGWQPAKAHQSTANKPQISKLQRQNTDLSSARGLNYALCRYLDVWNQMRLAERRTLGKYSKTIAVNSSKRALGEKTLAQAESCAVIYEVLGGILCLRRDSVINLFPIFENKVQLG